MGKLRLNRTWNEVRTNDSWAIFKIMSEFVNGFEKMSKIGPCVSIFGSARTQPGEKYYELAVSVANKIVEHGYGVITGGGPGIMEAGNKGAHLGGGTSVGLNIELPFEQHDNPYIDSDKCIDHDYFFVRKVYVGVQPNDGREVELLIDGAKFLRWVMGKHFGFFQKDQNESSLSGADADSLIVLG